MLPHASAVEARAWEIVEAVIGAPLTDQHKTPVQLPTDRSACQMPMPTAMPAAARAADLIEVGPHVRQVVVDWGLNPEAAKRVDGVEETVADGLLTNLANQCVTFSQPGRAVLVTETNVAATSPDLLRPPVPPRHTMSVILKVIASLPYLLRTSRARASGKSAGLRTPIWQYELRTSLVCIYWKHWWVKVPCH